MMPSPTPRLATEFAPEDGQEQQAEGSVAVDGQQQVNAPSVDF